MIEVQSKIRLPEDSVWREFKAKCAKLGVSVKKRIGKLIEKDLEK